MQTFSEYVSARHGPSWCVSARKTPALLARYGAVIPRKQYQALELAWEVETYGAPLKSLEKAAPALLAALRQNAAAFAWAKQFFPHTADQSLWDYCIARTAEAIAQAERIPVES